MIRFVALVLLVFSCASLQAQSNGGSTAAKQPTSSDVNSKSRKECVYKPVESNGARTRDDRQIDCVWEKNKGKIFVIYLQALKENPNLSGKVEISFRINANGRVQNAKIVHSDVNNWNFENKLLKHLESLQWPPMAGVIWYGSRPMHFYPATKKP